MPWMQYRILDVLPIFVKILKMSLSNHVCIGSFSVSNMYFKDVIPVYVFPLSSPTMFLYFESLYSNLQVLTAYKKRLEWLFKENRCTVTAGWPWRRIASERSNISSCVILVTSIQLCGSCCTSQACKDMHKTVLKCILGRVCNDGWMHNIRDLSATVATRRTETTLHIGKYSLS